MATRNMSVQCSNTLCFRVMANGALRLWGEIGTVWFLPSLDGEQIGAGGFRDHGRYNAGIAGGFAVPRLDAGRSGCIHPIGKIGVFGIAEISHQPIGAGTRFR